jgi:hypothetical protein
MRRAEGGANIFGVFRVKNHDFTQTNHIFSNFRGARPDTYVNRCASYLTLPLYKQQPLPGVILPEHTSVQATDRCASYLDPILDTKEHIR